MRTLAVMILMGCSGGEPPLDGVPLDLPAHIIFDQVSPQTTALQPLTIHNPSPTDVEILEVAAGEGFVTDAYTFTVDLQPQPLRRGATITGQVSFRARVSLESRVESFILIRTNAGTFTVGVQARTLSAPLLFSPEVVDFGVVARGSTTERPVVVQNRLLTPVTLTLEGIERLDGDGRFEIAGGTTKENGLAGGRALRPLESETLTIRYQRGTGSGAPPDRALMSVSVCERADCLVSLPLVASAETTPLVCSPSEVDFGAVRPGTRAEVEVLCQNRTAQRLIASASLTEPVFDLSDGADRVIEPNASLRWLLSFEPGTGDVAVQRTAILQIHGTDPENPAGFDPVELSVSGEGSLAQAVVPPTIDFGRAAVGAPVTRTLEVENRGASVLRVDITTTAPILRVGPATLEVPPNDKGVVTLRFEPTEPGIVVSDVLLSTNDPDRPTIQVRGTGEGLSLPSCTVALQPATVDFGRVELPRRARQHLTIENQSAGPCLIKDFMVTGPFRRVDGPSELLIPEMGRAELDLEIRPDATGPLQGTLSFYVSGPSAPTVSLVGEGGTLGLTLSPSVLSFGTAGAQCGRVERTVDLLNVGPRTIDVERVDVIGDDYALVSGGGSFTLPPAGRRVLTVSHDGEPGYGRIEVRELGSSGLVVSQLVSSGAVMTEQRHAVPREVDVLMVVQASDVVAQTNLAAAIGDFLGPARAEDVDWQIGVVTTDSLAAGCTGSANGMPETSTTTGACGFLANRGNASWRRVDRQTSPTPEVALGTLLQVGSGGFSPPAALAASFYALPNPILSAWNDGLIRTDAQTLVLFVTSEPDASAGPVAAWVSHLSSLRLDRHHTTVAAVAGGGCAPPAPRLQAAAGATGGSVVSICPADLAPGLAQLGALTAGRSVFFLDHPARAPTIEVEVDGAPIPAQYINYEDTPPRVTLSALVRPGPGGNVTVRYEPSCP